MPALLASSIEQASAVGAESRIGSVVGLARQALHAQLELQVSRSEEGYYRNDRSVTISAIYRTGRPIETGGFLADDAPGAAPGQVFRLLYLRAA